MRTVTGSERGVILVPLAARATTRAQAPRQAELGADSSSVPTFVHIGSVESVRAS